MTTILLPIQTINETAVVSTFDFAEGLGIQHKNLIETVRGYQSAIEKDFGRVAFQTRPFETPGGVQHREIALLTGVPTTFFDLKPLVTP